MKRCGSCKKLLPDAAFYVRAGYLRSMCRECTKAYNASS